VAGPARAVRTVEDLDEISVRRDGPGRPRKRPDRVVADKAYSHPSTRAARRRRRIRFTSPELGQVARRPAKGARGGRPPAFDHVIYAGRNVVERCFNRLEQFRDLATRYAKRAAYFRAEIAIAAAILRLRQDLQDTPWSIRPRHVHRRPRWTEAVRRRTATGSRARSRSGSNPRPRIEALAA
jgi:transposase